MIDKPQLFLDIVRDAVAPEIERLGLTVPNVPIAINELNMWLFGYEAGSTRFKRVNDVTTNEPQQITISPRTLEWQEPATIAGVLAHEMVHSALPFWPDGPGDGGHGPTFQRYVRALGLTDGSPEEAKDGPEWREFYARVIAPRIAAAGIVTSDKVEEPELFGPEDRYMADVFVDLQRILERPMYSGPQTIRPPRRLHGDYDATGSIFAMDFEPVTRYIPSERRESNVIRRHHIQQGRRGVQLHRAASGGRVSHCHLAQRAWLARKRDHPDARRRDATPQRTEL